MTPSDIECPRCKAAKGEKCVATRLRFFQDINGRPDHEEIEIKLDYHHAERVDAWARALEVPVGKAPREADAKALVAALRYQGLPHNPLMFSDASGDVIDQFAHEAVLDQLRCALWQLERYATGAAKLPNEDCNVLSFVERTRGEHGWRQR